MSRIREVIVLIICFLAEGGLIYQAKEPQHATGTYFIMLITGGDQLTKNEQVRHVAHFIVYVICAIAFIGLLLFALDFLGGKSKGLLKYAYFIIAIYTAIQITACLLIYAGYYDKSTNIPNLDMRLLSYFVSELIMLAVLIIYILREIGIIRPIRNLSSVLLIVIVGQVLSNGVLLAGRMWYTIVICGVVTMLPTLAIFVFETFILEASIRRQG